MDETGVLFFSFLLLFYKNILPQDDYRLICPMADQKTGVGKTPVFVSSQGVERSGYFS